MLKGLIITLLLISFFVSTVYPNIEADLSRSLGCSSESTLHVGGSGGGNYTSIQDAINDASDGDCIIVYPGVYHEHLVVSKSLRLKGVDVNSTVVDGDAESSDAVITAPFTSIENLTFRRSGGYCNDALIEAVADNVSVHGCVFCNARNGLLLSSSVNKVENCFFFHLGVGVDMEHSSRNTLCNLSFKSNALAVFLNSSHFNVLSSFEGCYNGVDLLFLRSNVNRVENCVFFYGNENQGSIYIDSSTGNILSNCFLHDNGYSIRLYNSKGNKILNSSMSYNKEGVDFYSSSHNTVYRCIFLGNNLGVYSDESSNKVLYSDIENQKSFGVIGQKTFVDARYNWWGSVFGPGGRGIGVGDKILWLFGRIRYIPWLLRPFDAIKTSNVAFKEATPSLCDASVRAFAENDSDGDLCSNQWEEKWGYDPFVWDNHLHLDPDNDGLNNVEECVADRWGSNPFHKDIFVEVDWMQKDFKLSEEYKERLTTLFRQHNITLHIDDGSLGGGEQIRDQMDLTYKDVVDIYWDDFLHNNLDNPRKGIFHYVVLCHQVPARTSGGFCFVGWYSIDGFTLAIDYDRNRLPPKKADFVEASTFLHELGHTLGLFYYKFEGIDNASCQYMLPGVWKYRSYRSCMNYEYVWSLLNYSDGTNGVRDFDDWTNLDLSFFKKSEWRE